MPFGNSIKYEVRSKGETIGPLDFSTIERMTDKGEFLLENSIRKSGSKDSWLLLHDVLQSKRKGESGVFLFIAIFLSFLGSLLLYTIVRDPALNGRHSISGAGVGIMLLYTGALLALAAFKNFQIPLGKLPSPAAKRKILFCILSVITGFIFVFRLP